jgi:hypothetical protein
MSIVLIVFVVFLVVYRRRLGKLKNKYTYILLSLSVLWWLYLVIDQLNTDLVCGAYDEFCNSGNTFWGDVSWASGIAIITASIVWIPYTITALILSRANRTK